MIDIMFLREIFKRLLVHVYALQSETFFFNRHAIPLILRGTFIAIRFWNHLKPKEKLDFIKLLTGLYIQHISVKEER